MTSFHKVWGTLFCGVLLAWNACGCQKTVSENLISNPGIEEPLDGNGLPRGWAFSVTSGEYKHEAAESSQSGKLALVIAGSKGAADLQTNASPVSSGSVLECEAWLQTQLVKGGEPSVYVKFSHGDASERSGLIRINPTLADWQRVHFFCNVERDCSANLAIRLSGEGLVRLDDLSMKVASQLSPAELVTAHTFENLNEKGELAEWTHVYRAKKGEFKVVKESESSSVRMDGNAGWSVLCTRRAITTKPSRIILQGLVKVNQGTGQLKIDYIKKDNCFKSTLSPAGTKEWTFVSVESEPALVEESDAIRATLAATGTTDYSVEFDAVDVFIEN